MRRAFVEALVSLALEDERIVLLTGDLGFSVVEPFADRFPDRFFNAGVAEQNMVGMATGLAEAGFVPFLYSIATFATMRPFEFLRNGAVLHGLSVRVVGVGAGLDYGHNGMTHFALEDIGLMRTQPTMTIITPADPADAAQAVRATAEVAGPIYFRLGKDGIDVPGLRPFELGRASILGAGRDLALVALGTMAPRALEASRLLSERGIAATVCIVSSISPPPLDDLVPLLETVPLAVTIEGHGPNGGLGSLVAECIAEGGLGCRLLRRAVDQVPEGISGSADFLYGLVGLDAEQIAASVLDTLATRAS